jgi:hypothetical protein
MGLPTSCAGCDGGKGDFVIDAGHWRAISPGVTESMTVTNGTLDAQLRAVRGLDRSDSQADSAGSIPVTRSTTKPPLTALSLGGVFRSAALHSSIRAHPLTQLIGQAHSSRRPGCMCRLPPRTIVPFPAAASRPPCGRVAARWLRQPRLGVRSPGFGAYEEEAHNWFVSVEIHVATRTPKVSEPSRQRSLAEFSYLLNREPTFVGIQFWFKSLDRHSLIVTPPVPTTAFRQKARLIERWILT